MSLQNLFIIIIVILILLGILYIILTPGKVQGKHKKKKTKVKQEAKSAQELRSTLREENKGFFKDLVEKWDLRNVLEEKDLESKLGQAGYRGQRPITTFYTYKLLLPMVAIFISAFYVFIASPSDRSLTLNIFIILITAALGYYAPAIFLKNQAKKRLISLKPFFPDALDLLLICVESGMSLEAGITRVAKEITTSSLELAEELTITATELAYLPSRVQAYENLIKRNLHPGIKSIGISFIQIDAYGTPLGDALRVLAKENRILRQTEAEKKAAALPTLLTVPMMVFFIPVLFIILLTPAVFTIIENF